MGSARRAATGCAAVVMAAMVAGGAVMYTLRDRPTPITVERGDTLFLLAEEHAVTVDELRSWNGIEGDLIEVGQVLLIWRTPPPAAVQTEAPHEQPRARSRRPRSSGSPAPGPPKLSMPAEKPCLAEPELSGTADAEMVASQGLDAGEIRDAMSSFVHHTLSCIAGSGSSPSEALRLEITVACTGQVSDVTVLAGGDWPSEVAGCVTETLRYAPFPAHDLPGGESFEYPLRYRAP